jgi:ABC-type sulfate/molybdate transport systems ATPase subunit
LILNPRVMLLDEPLEGLAPILVEELLRALRRIIRDEGMSAILVEQNAQKVLGVTDRAAILERGAVVYEGASADLSADRAVLESYLGVTAVGPRRGGKTRHLLARLARCRDWICPTWALSLRVGTGQRPQARTRATAMRSCAPRVDRDNSPSFCG